MSLLTSFFLYSRLYKLSTTKEADLEASKYCFNSYKDLLTYQIYLSDIVNISMSYTDTISISELIFLYETTIDYIKEKNRD